MLTKSDYIKFLQCSKYLWLHKNRKDLLGDKTDNNLESIFATGFAVEKIVYELYPVGIEVGTGDFLEVINKTRILMNNKRDVIFQPSISGNNLFCRADIISYDKKLDAWDIIEVKSSTEVKDIHVDDLSFQKICFEKAGFKIAHTFLAHINNQYVRKGEINPRELIKIEDISDLVSKREEKTKEEIEKALKILELEKEPEVEILRQCHSSYDCSFIDYCWKDFPEHSIYSISSVLGEKKMKKLLEEGIMEVKDIPQEYLTNDKLKKHHHAVKNNTVHIEKDNIKSELEKIQYPIYFLDYETYGPAIPIMDGYRPYQAVVFQYSLHVQKEKNGKLEHYYFLSKGLKDPTKELSKTLKERIGKAGSVIAWNMGFEQGCNDGMGERAPEYKEFYKDINNRMYDLMDVFKKGYYVYKDFYTSASLKKVLPVVVPELSYKDMDIGEGMQASNAWGDMVSEKTSPEEKEKIYEDLLKYCELDTLAMVRILEELNEIIK